jgi:hypothetical protein
VHSVLHEPAPILIVDRFPALLDALLSLLAGLPDEEWLRPVHGGAWTVKRAQLAGDLRLAETVLRTVAIIA